MNTIQINTKQELDRVLQTHDNVFVLFYADWCGFSQRFLPIFESCAQTTKRPCFRMMVDDLPDLLDKYQIEVYPTVLFFSKGEPAQRLDGLHGIGLSEQEFRKLIQVCDCT